MPTKDGWGSFRTLLNPNATPSADWCAIINIQCNDKDRYSIKHLEASIGYIDNTQLSSAISSVRIGLVEDAGLVSSDRYDSFRYTSGQVGGAITPPTLDIDKVRQGNMLWEFQSSLPNGVISRDFEYGDLVTSKGVKALQFVVSFPYRNDDVDPATPTSHIYFVTMNLLGKVYVPEEDTPTYKRMMNEWSKEKLGA